jgi:hypothetical protein
MGTRANSPFAVKSWDEKPYEEFEGGRKLTRASVADNYEGAIEGEGTVQTDEATTWGWSAWWAELLGALGAS